MGVNVGKAVAYLDIDTTKFKKGLRGVAGDLKTFADGTQNSSTRIKGLSSAMGTVGSALTKGVTTPLLGVGTAAVKTAYNFEKQMARVKSISGATGGEFESLQDKAKEMGATTIFTSLDAANAMEYMGMAGWDAQEMIDGLPGIMNLAAASGEDLALVSDIVTDALTGFGMSASDTTRFVDVLAAAATNSNTNVSMMGETFKYAAPVAGSLGYSVEDTAIAIGLMANSGIKASQAGTSLRSLMTNLAKPVGESEVAVNALGLSLTDSAGNMKSFKEIMDELRSKFGELKMPQDEVERKLNELNEAFENGTITEDEYNKSVEELTKNALGAADAEKAKYAAMLAGKTGMSGLLAILNASEEDYNDLTEAIYGSKDAAEEMAKTQRDTLWGSFELLKSAISAVLQTIGEYLIPYIRDFTEWLTALVDKFNSLSESEKEQIIKIGLIVAAIGPALIIISKILGVFSNLIGIISKVGSGISLLVKVFGKLIGFLPTVGSALATVGKVLLTAITAHPIIAAITAIIAIFVTLYAKCEWFRDGVNNVLEFIKKGLSGAFEKVKELFGESIPEIIGNLLTFVGDLPKSLAKLGLQVIRGFIEGITGIDIVEEFKKICKKMLNGIKDFFGIHSPSTVMKQIGLNILKGLVNGLIGLPGEVLKIFSLLLKKITGSGNDMVKTASKAASNILKGFVNGVKNLPGQVMNILNTLPKRIKVLSSVLKSAAKVALNGLLDGFKSVGKNITDFISNLGKNISDALSNVGEKVSGFVGNIFGGGTTKSSVYGSHAGGLSYVPFDGYRAELHEGERVLTKGENEQYSNGSISSGGDTFIFYNTQPDPYEYYREMKKAKKELQYGF